MSQELEKLLSDNPVPLLRYFAQSNAQALKEQINKAEPGQKTFLLQMIGNNRSIDTQRDILNLCLENGYSLKTATLNDQQGMWRFPSNPQYIPDYLHLWSKVSDKLLSEITQSLGKDYLLELEEKYPVLKKAYDRSMIETIRTLEKFGLGTRQDLYKPDEILQLAQNNPETLKVYWESRNNPEAQFESIKEYFAHQLKEFSTASGVTDNYKTEKLDTYIKKEFPSMSIKQQEDLIAQAFTCINQKPYLSAVKAYGGVIKHYKGTQIPVWKYLDDATNHNSLHKVLNDKVALGSNFEGISYLEALSKMLGNLRYSGQNENNASSRSTDFSKIRFIQNKLEDVYDQDFWLTPNPKDNHHPWFHTASQSVHMLKVFAKDWLNVNPEEMNYYKQDKKEYKLANYPHIENKDNLYWSEHRLDKKAVIKDLLDKTWLYKDETNQYCIEHAIKNYYPLLSHEKINHQLSEFIKMDSNDIFPLKVKEKMLYNVFDINKNSELLKSLLENLQHEPKMNWNKFLETVKESKSYTKINSYIEILIGKINLEQKLEEKPTGKINKI